MAVYLGNRAKNPIRSVGGTGVGRFRSFGIVGLYFRDLGIEYGQFAAIEII